MGAILLLFVTAVAGSQTAAFLNERTLDAMLAQAPAAIRARNLDVVVLASGGSWEQDWGSAGDCYVDGYVVLTVLDRWGIPSSIAAEAGKIFIEAESYRPIVPRDDNADQPVFVYRNHNVLLVSMPESALDSSSLDFGCRGSRVWGG